VGIYTACHLGADEVTSAGGCNFEFDIQDKPIRVLEGGRDTLRNMSPMPSTNQTWWPDQQHPSLLLSLAC
jgi:hypothetical protein